MRLPVIAAVFPAFTHFLQAHSSASFFDFRLSHFRVSLIIGRTGSLGALYVRTHFNRNHIFGLQTPMRLCTLTNNKIAFSFSILHRQQYSLIRGIRLQIGQTLP